MKRRYLVLAVAISALGTGCAQHYREASERECAAAGFVPGTEAYKSCWAARYDARQASLQQSLARTQQSIAAAQGVLAQPSYSVNNGGVASGSAYLQNNYVSGMNRVCLYDRMGSTVAVTVGAADICPINQQSYAQLSNAGRIGGTAGGTAFLRSDFVSGVNRICQYDRMGSAVVTTVSAAETCPISLP